MKQDAVDLFVIGAGSGGVRAARLAAAAGARVAIAERYRVGGTCVVRGCIPKKLMRYAARCQEDLEDAYGYGWSDGNGHPPRGEFSWPRFREAMAGETGRLSELYRKNLLASGATLHEGHATITGPHTVAIGDRITRADHILVATGGRPYFPPVPGLELTLSSNDVFALDRLPSRIIVLGSGYIAVEFASILCGLGVEVSLVFRRNRLLGGLDSDLRDYLAGEMERRGVRLLCRSTPVAVERDDAGGFTVHLREGGTVRGDAVLCALGRIPALEGLGLGTVGITPDAGGRIPVDGYGRTVVPSILAIGDVSNRMNLTPVAIREAVAVIRTILGGQPTPLDHGPVPAAVFSIPPLASVGMTGEEAAAQGETDVWLSAFRPLRHTLSGRESRALVKVIADRTTGRILGAHMGGEEAPEIIQMLAVAIGMQATKACLDRTMALHPTLAEEFVTLSGEPVRRDGPRDGQARDAPADALPHPDGED